MADQEEPPVLVALLHENAPGLDQHLGGVLEQI
jgi:hypothetical protein